MDEFQQFAFMIRLEVLDLDTKLRGFFLQERLELVHIAKHCPNARSTDHGDTPRPIPRSES